MLTMLALNLVYLGEFGENWGGQSRLEMEGIGGLAYHLGMAEVRTLLSGM